MLCSVEHVRAGNVNVELDPDEWTDVKITALSDFYVTPWINTRLKSVGAPFAGTPPDPIPTIAAILTLAMIAKATRTKEGKPSANGAELWKQGEAMLDLVIANGPVGVNPPAPFEALDPDTRTYPDSAHFVGGANNWGGLAERRANDPSTDVAES